MPFAAPDPAGGLCRACRSAKSAISAATAYGSYEGTLRQLVLLFKYRGIDTLAKPLAALAASAARPHSEFDLVVAMPMHWLRQWKRGFNQAELLAKPIAGSLGIPLVKPLRRVKLGKRQATLSASDRRRNLEKAFAVSKRVSVSGKRILLVDDVLTTGSTLAAAASVLKRAGAMEVSALTVARVVRRSGLPPGAG